MRTHCGGELANVKLGAVEFIIDGVSDEFGVLRGVSMHYGDVQGARIRFGAR